MTFDHGKDCAAASAFRAKISLRYQQKSYCLNAYNFNSLKKWKRSILTAGRNLKDITDGFLTCFNSQYQYVKSQMKASRTV